ncbi:MAG: ABC transporter substrate-binding protein [bacterium]
MRRFSSAIAVAAMLAAALCAWQASAAEKVAGSSKKDAASASAGTGGAASSQTAAAETKEVGGKIKKYYPEGSPTRAIQNLDDILDDFKVAENEQKLSSADQARNDQLKQKIIHGTFDIRELARQSLGSHWNQCSEGDRDRFVQLLTDLLEQKALFSKEQSAAKSKSGGKYFVVYRGHKFEDAASTRSYVRTKVVVPSENIDILLNYRLKKASDDWKIYDVIVDEASLVDNYKYQFDSIIKKHGFADLLRRMSEKLAEIRGKRNN